MKNQRDIFTLEKINPMSSWAVGRYISCFDLELSYLQCTGATVITKAMLPSGGSHCTKRAEPCVFPTRVGGAV